MKPLFGPLTIHFLLIFVTASHAGDFALRDGDTVVFLGDSITAARTYGKTIENYTLLRYPGRKVRFINSGWGGDTAAGGAKRLDRDVFAYEATVLIVAYGVNDIGWGVRADAEHEKIYLDAIDAIIQRCREKKVRLFLCSAAITAEDPDKAENGFLQQMCDKGLVKAKAAGMGAIDLQREMRRVQRKVLAWNKAMKDGKNKESLHVADGVHLNDLGQLAMAWAILKGLGAPAEVSSVAIDAGSGKVAPEGCKVTQVEASPDCVTFTRLDNGLPLNQGIFFALNYRFVPIFDELNRYMLKVNGLADGQYDVVADRRNLGSWSAKQLAAGINVCSATADGWQPGGPWNVQANILREFTEARNQLSLGMLLSKTYQDAAEVAEISKRAREINDRLEQLQREAAKPKPYRFEIRKAVAKKSG